jgi:hypothetical protein
MGLADLVEKDRAAVRDLEQALLVLVRARERAAHVAEQLALEQRVGQRGAVLRHEALALARPRSVARATRSLPVPVSPVISTVASVPATFSITSNTRFIAGPEPISWSNA